GAFLAPTSCEAIVQLLTPGPASRTFHLTPTRPCFNLARSSFGTETRSRPVLGAAFDGVGDGLEVFVAAFEAPFADEFESPPSAGGCWTTTGPVGSSPSPGSSPPGGSPPGPSPPSRPDSFG